MSRPRRLEGSRFGALLNIPTSFLPASVQLQNVKAGGSRERLSAWQLYRVPFLFIYDLAESMGMHHAG